MKKDLQMLSKGFYQYAQLDRFVMAKNYMFLRNKGKKFLLIRFYNDMDYRVEEMTFTIYQLDASGKMLDSSKVTCDHIFFRPGCYYTMEEAVMVHELCNDVRVVFNEVVSDQYVYRPKDGRAIAYYSSDYVGMPSSSSDYYDEEALTVKKKKYGRYKLASWMAFILLLSLLALNVGYYVFEKMNQHRIPSRNQQISYLVTEHEVE